MKRRKWPHIARMLLLLILAGCSSSTPEPVTITISVGSTSEAGNRAIEEQAQVFSAQQPDIEVEVLFSTESTDGQHDVYVEQLRAGSADIDVMAMDIIWAPEFGAQGWTVPLDDYVAAHAIDLSDFLPGSIQASTWQGELVAMPQFIDVGMLYYRRDLLEKYGFAPPTTWDELVRIAETIVAAERASSPELVGFVYQADRYEGLVCNYLEYVWGNGAAVLDATGTRVVLDTPQAVEALETFAAMQAIAPPGILSFKEADALNYFESSNAVFMRNWPYAWVEANGPDSSVAGNVGFAPLPHGPGWLSGAAAPRVASSGAPGGAPISPAVGGASALGGWQLGINAFSEHPDEAFALVAFLTSPEQQSYAAIHAGQLPTRRSVYRDPDVLASNPYMEPLSDVFAGARPRPVHPRYATDISPIIQAEVYRTLLGEQDAATATAAMAAQIQAAISEE